MTINGWSIKQEFLHIVRFRDFLPESHNPLYQDCRVTGWGKKTIEGELTDILLQSRVPILSNAKCQLAYGDHIKIHEGHICGGKLEKKAGAPCVGDSGGGLQCREGHTGSWILVGITSFGWNCSLKLPDVFTRITYYVQWINKVISILAFIVHMKALATMMEIPIIPKL
uniref:Peptidase S1 domain-containing protein n=1 Tax=Lutzomyia longipalpis TaxID=7200 RepID=A0A1B0CQV5_LUTLO